MKVVPKTIRVLIGYASRFGSTQDIANRIADAVRKDGSEVDVRSVEEIADPHLHVHARRPGSTTAPLSGEPVPIRLGGRYLVRNDRVYSHPHGS